MEKYSQINNNAMLTDIKWKGNKLSKHSSLIAHLSNDMSMLIKKKFLCCVQILQSQCKSKTQDPVSRLSFVLFLHLKNVTYDEQVEFMRRVYILCK